MASKTAFQEIAQSSRQIAINPAWMAACNMMGNGFLPSDLARIIFGVVRQKSDR